MSIHIAMFLMFVAGWLMCKAYGWHVIDSQLTRLKDAIELTNAVRSEYEQLRQEARQVMAQWSDN